MFENTRYHEYFLPLEPGQMLLLYTDGVTEAAAASGDEYGQERLAAAACKGRLLGARDLINRIYDDILRHTEGRLPTDDVTLVVIRALDGEGSLARDNGRSGRVRRSG
jgi:sigma-B regulation protein RsbU (phosphoserine phosphatase)